MLRSASSFTLVVAASLLGYSSSAAGPSDKDDEAGKKFGELKIKLPKIVSKDLNVFWPGMEATVELARRTGPAEGKVTVVFTGGTEKSERASAFIYLCFHDGKWTSTRWEGWVYEDDAAIKRVLNRQVQIIMRGMDKAIGD